MAPAQGAAARLPALRAGMPVHGATPSPSTAAVTLLAYCCAAEREAVYACCVLPAVTDESSVYNYRDNCPASLHL